MDSGVAGTLAAGAVVKLAAFSS